MILGVAAIAAIVQDCAPGETSVGRWNPDSRKVLIPSSDVTS